MYLFLLVLLVQFAGPVLKATGLAYTERSWWYVTCFLWGPWLLAFVLAILGWLLYLTDQRKTAQFNK